MLMPQSPTDTTALAQALADHLRIAPQDWHRLKGNRQARGAEALSVALVYLLKDQPQEALTYLRQAEGWLDRSLKAPVCGSHGRPAERTIHGAE
ncbi:MAG: hypothetical protein IGQ88_06985 [Gloeomargaritaceae cyanobacterium C42_A2020_066]|nr:hypothetical protein [Gloeomargaritaceae cyanobacterium C42_A2020_066]